jgi:lipopolysaccharide transport system ATP-binding protein
VSGTAIRVEGLGKRYRIGARQPYYTLRESLTQGVTAPLRRLENIFRNANISRECTSLAKPGTGPPDQFIWALRDVSFTIERGQVVGMIGRNGAGKSTLLKILTRVTPPSEGEAEVFGRVGSLLEVGTGFHPELTGRENIYVNGAILGMKIIEIDRKFDEIVTFAEVEKFIDTPVKHYSSGLYMRLAFAVAVHLEPEILLLDEVLAVGDIEFQKRCIGKMEKVAGEGKTVIIVSHSMSTVKALCTKAILLDRGGVKCMGSVDAVVNEYLHSHRADPLEKDLNDEDHENGGGKAIRVKRITLLRAASNSFSVYWKQPISVSLEIEVFDDIEEVSFGAGLRTLDGAFVFVVYNDGDGRPPWTLRRGHYVVEIIVQNSLRPGLYRLHVGGYQRYARFKNLFAVDAANLEVLDFTEQGAVPSIADPGLVGGVASAFAHKILTPSDGQNAMMISRKGV